MTEKDWLDLQKCSQNVVRKFYRKLNFTFDSNEEDFREDLAQDVMENAAKYLLQGKKPKASLASFVFMYGLMPVIYGNKQRVFEEQIMSTEAFTECEGKDIDSIMQDAFYKDGKIILKSAWKGEE